MAKSKSGFAGMNLEQIMMQQAQKKVDEPVYCYYCGKNVKVAQMNSSKNWNQYLEWETENRAHVNCTNKARGQRR